MITFLVNLVVFGAFFGPSSSTSCNVTILFPCSSYDITSLTTFLFGESFYNSASFLASSFILSNESSFIFATSLSLIFPYSSTYVSLTNSTSLVSTIFPASSTNIVFSRPSLSIIIFLVNFLVVGAL